MLEAADALRQARRVLLAAHVSPDVDAIGSLLAMGLIIKRLGGRAFLLSEGGVPHEAGFLPGTQQIITSASGEYDLLVTVDCSELRRAGRYFSNFEGLPLLNIDHHVSNTYFGSWNVVDPTLAATAQIVLRLASCLGLSLDQPLATCILAGLVSDSQGFRTSNTDERVLADALTLMNAGADLKLITRHVLNNRPRQYIGLWGKALDRAVLEDGIVYSTIPLVLRQLTGVPEGDDAGIVNYLVGTNGTLAAALFSEKSNGSVDVNLRSVIGVDVSSVALAFGGGGHAQAAGCNVLGGLDNVRDAILAKLRQVVRESSVRSVAAK